MIAMEHIDGGQCFDFGKTSEAYAKYRDIYPDAFYRKLLDKGIGTQGQHILDIGTGTGVIPRNMHRYGARFTGTDIAPHQIEQARRLAQAAEMSIAFVCCPAEQMPFADSAFDAVTACQCFTYFDHNALAPQISRVLKPGGRLAVMYMAWLPCEDAVAQASEELVLRYNPHWTGGGEVRHEIVIPAVYDEYFEKVSSEVFDLSVPFTRESWNGRMKSCRGIGASLSAEEIEAFEREHLALLERIAPERFDILHYAAVTVLQKA